MSIDTFSFCSEIFTLWPINMKIVKLYFQQMISFFFRGPGGGEGLWKMITDFLFLATLNFVNGPLACVENKWYCLFCGQYQHKMKNYFE